MKSGKKEKKKFILSFPFYTRFINNMTLDPSTRRRVSTLVSLKLVIKTNALQTFASTFFFKPTTTDFEVYRDPVLPAKHKVNTTTKEKK